jgi:hypothetical protein
VKFFGCEAGAYMLYDESEEQLEIRGAAADAATSTGKLLLSTALTNINANDVIGSINFQAPLEAGDCDSRLVAAGIRAVAQATFTCAVNATDLIFYTGHSEAATEKFRFTSQGEIGIGGATYGSDGHVLTSGGAGAAVAWEAAASGATSTAAETETRAAAAATGCVSYTGAGFAPTGVWIFAGDTANDDTFSWGIGDQDDNQQVFAFRDVEGANWVMNPNNTQIVVMSDPCAGCMQAAVLTSLDSDGMTLAWTKTGSGRAANMRIMYIR